MCRNHLLGEHREIHTLISSLIRKRKLDGYIRNNCLELKSIKQRHELLVKEMQRRNYKHKSELDKFDLSYLEEKIINYMVDRRSSLEDLVTRCPNCKKNFIKRGKFNEEKLKVNK
jgi:hypothetical protein